MQNFIPITRRCMENYSITVTSNYFNPLIETSLTVSVVKTVTKNYNVDEIAKARRIFYYRTHDKNKYNFRALLAEAFDRCIFTTEIPRSQYTLTNRCYDYKMSHGTFTIYDFTIRGKITYSIF